MESVIEWICLHADHAHYFFFLLLMLAGLNIPVSEDLILITGGVLASTVVPENTYVLFVWIFLGAYLSDWEAYWIGRGLGPKLWKSRWFCPKAAERRILRIQDFYNRYGMRTLLIGRFIPFGVRNCLFITAGLGRMPFGRFIVADGIACFVSNALLFSLAYAAGNNYESLYSWVMTVNWVIFTVFIASLVVAVLVWKRRPRAELPS